MAADGHISDYGFEGADVTVEGAKESTIVSGETITITAIEPENGRLSYVKMVDNVNNIEYTENPVNIVVSSDLDISVYFKENTCVVYVNENNPEYGKVLGGAVVPRGTNHMIGGKPNEGHILRDWTMSIDGGEPETVHVGETHFEITNIQNNYEFTANFE